MAWSTIRKATEADVAALEQRANAFMARHGIESLFLDATATFMVEEHLAYLRDHDSAEYAHLNRLWLGVVRRALGHKRAEGIAYGYVGFSAD